MRLLQFLNAACIVSAAATPLPRKGQTEDTALLWNHPLQHNTARMDSISAQLQPLLSPGASLSSTAPPRWSLFSAPKPAAVVNVGNEADVAAVVKYCAAHNIPFFAQNGASGWAALNVTDGVVINLAPLNQVTFNADKTQATIGGGVIVAQAIAAGKAAGAFLLTGNCDCVGALGANLGGGYGNLIGAYGFGVDNFISMNVVLADGSTKHVSADCEPDLFWALRGAGPNFGIVTSAVVKSYPDSNLNAWTTALVFPGDQITQVAQAVEALRPNLQPTQNVYLYLTNNSGPVILVTGFFLHATPEQGKAAFAGLYALNPVFENSGVLPYDQWNAAAANFCLREQRKPGHNVGITQLHPEQWKSIWDLYVDFRNQPGAENSVVIVEIYNLAKARTIPAASSAYGHRNVNAQAIVIPWYTDAALDTAALAFANKVRDIWKSTEPKFASYINFAYGDEGQEAIYGASLPRLKALKKKYDPKNRFNQWFNIQ